MRIDFTIRLIKIDHSYYMLVPQAVRNKLDLHESYQVSLRYQPKARQLKSIIFHSGSKAVMQQKDRSKIY
jgi:hypothetical protein